MRRNQITLPLPTGWANTHGATALSKGSWEQNILVLVTKGGPGHGFTCYPPFQDRGLFPLSFWENVLGTKQVMEKGHHKGYHILSKELTELTYEFITSFIHSLTKYALSTY